MASKVMEAKLFQIVSTSMFEKMHAAPAFLALLLLTKFQFHLISKSTKISLTPLKNVCEKSLHMLENHSFYVLQNNYLTSIVLYGEIFGLNVLFSSKAIGRPSCSRFWSSGLSLT